MSRKVSNPEKAFVIYAAMDADERKEFWAYCAGYDRALGLAGVVPQSLPKRRGRPVGSKNKSTESLPDLPFSAKLPAGVAQ